MHADLINLSNSFNAPTKKSSNVKLSPFKFGQIYSRFI